MPNLLLSTKLYIPTRRVGSLHRPRLIELLNQGLEGKLTLVSAPAGFGKTTLLSDWISQSKIPFAWLSLDENDNDLVRFLAYFIAALQTIQVNIDEQLLAMLQSPQHAAIEAVLIPLINQIAQTKHRFALVLDDYHLIESQDIHDALNFFLDHQPPTMHLVIASRSDPPLPLARLRASGEMAEIRESHLRFSIEEGDHLLNQVQGLSLSREDIRALIDRTEGWIAGLQLASLALKGKTNASEYIQGFSGSQEYIADYLTDEVLTQQPEHIQNLLLKTSILDRLSGSLCDAITGQQDGQQVLKQLKGANLFLVSLDDESRWYRYHRLFTDLLHQRLLESQPEVVPGLYLKASQWSERNGFFEDAIDYSFRGGHCERAAELIEQVAEQTIKHSEIVTFMRWIERLPDQLVRSNATLSIFYAWALLISEKQPQLAESYLRDVEPENEHIRNRLTVVKAMLAVYQRQIPNVLELARQALEQLPLDDLFFRNIAAWNLSALLYISGDTESGEKMLEEVARVSRASGNLLVAIITLCRLATAQMQKGKLFRSKDLFQQALDLATAGQGEMLPIACEALLGLGKIYWERYQIDTACNYLLEGIELSKRWKDQVAIDGYITLAHIRQTQGNVELADQMIEKARELAAQTNVTESDDHYVALQQACLWLRRRNLPAAKRWAKERGLDQNLYKKKLASTQSIGADLILRYELIVFARLLIAESRSDEALRLLDVLLPFMEQMGVLGKVIEIKILQAIGFQAQGNIDQAISTLTTTIALTQPEGYVRPFLDEGPAVIELLEKTAERGVEDANELLGAFLKPLPVTTTQSKAAELLEPLSDREMQVLHLLQTDLSVPEIAEQLFIAVSTVRSHVKSIYGKLGVHSRFEAVDQAIDLGLL